MDHVPTYLLRRAHHEDRDALAELFAHPEVNRFLADGRRPAPAALQAWIDEANDDGTGRGLWLLESGDGEVVGAYRLAARCDVDAALELTYLLHPGWWRRGLATAGARAVLEHTFRGGATQRVVAGADLPNATSIAVMRRLGMTPLGPVDYPMGPGVEYFAEASAWLEQNREAGRTCGLRLRFG